MTEDPKRMPKPGWKCAGIKPEITLPFNRKIKGLHTLGSDFFFVCVMLQHEQHDSDDDQEELGDGLGSHSSLP